MEYELIDTGIFDDGRYFDVFCEYAKASPKDIFIRIRAVNRGPDEAPLHVLPTLWFRNTWSFWPDSPRPEAHRVTGPSGVSVIEARHDVVGERWLYVDDAPALLFTENETNAQRIFGADNPTPYVKDGVGEFVIHGRTDAVNPELRGTKAAAHYVCSIPPGQTVELRLRLSATGPERLSNPFQHYHETFEARIREADEFYARLTPRSLGHDEAQVLRQAMAGLLWTKQFYFYDVETWLAEHGVDPLSSAARPIRNRDWSHMTNQNIISMPDKWEYPWYAAWDLAFHAVAFGTVDIDFAKGQLERLLRELYMHPNGQLPAYEWNFGDVNPPTHPWACLFLYRLEERLHGRRDIEFLKHAFGKLLSNFTWWVNRKDRNGRNVYEGGFLGLDNIGVFDRSAPLPTGGYLEQADGTAWMALFCQNMLSMAVEIATVDPTYEDLAVQFVEHFLLIGRAVNRLGPEGMWDEEDGFYYDVLRLPDGSATRLKVRSLVGLLPLCATTVIEKQQRDRVPRLVQAVHERLRLKPSLLQGIHPTGPEHLGQEQRGILALVAPDRLRRILAVMLDENEFLSPYGIRSLSRFHAEHPYSFYVHGQEYRVGYLPAESDSGMFGGNSNWRGPVWVPMNALLIRALMQFYQYYGDTLRVECPTGSGNHMNLFEVAQEIQRRMTRIFLRGEDGRRPVFGGAHLFQNDPHWRDHLLFYEYFHGDNGAGLGASHQTGWTALVGTLMQYLGSVDAETFLRFHGARGRAA